MRTIASAGMLWALLTALLVSGACAAAYLPTYLSTPDGFRSPKAKAINAAGDIAGTAVDSLGREHAFVWGSNGTVRELQMPAGYVSCGIHDINALDQCAGYATDASGNGHAVVWYADGTPRDLGALDGIYSVARSINIHGQIVGWSGTADGSVHAMLWDTSGNATDLDQAHGWGWSRAHGINDSGQIVGGCTGGAFLLTGDVIRELGDWTGNPPRGEAIALNSRGDAIGAQDALGGTPVLWRADGSVVALETPDSPLCYPWSINAQAATAGSYQAPSGGYPFPYAMHAAIWSAAGQLTDIHPAGMASSYANDINDSGWVVGYCSTSTTTYAVAWVPVPEPPSWLALAPGLGLLLRRRRS